MSSDPIYTLARSGKTFGQFSLTQVREGLKSGQILPQDHFWMAGMAEWSTVEQLAAKIRELDRAEAERIANQRKQAEELAAKREAELRAEAQRRSAVQAKPETQKPSALPVASSNAATKVTQPVGAASGTDIDVPVVVGSGLVFIGCFLPMVAAPILSGANLSLIGNGTGETAVCAFLSAKTAIQAIHGARVKVAAAFWSGVALLAIPVLKLIYLLIDLGITAMRMRDAMGGSRRSSDDSGFSFDYNPFDGAHLSIVELLPIPLTLGVGFACVLLGTLMLYKPYRNR